jgi:hypothetical protein
MTVDGTVTPENLTITPERSETRKAPPPIGKPASSDDAPKSAPARP